MVGVCACFSGAECVGGVLPCCVLSAVFQNPEPACRVFVRSVQKPLFNETVGTIPVQKGILKRGFCRIDRKGPKCSNYIDASPQLLTSETAEYYMHEGGRTNTAGNICVKIDGEQVRKNNSNKKNEEVKMLTGSR